MSVDIPSEVSIREREETLVNCPETIDEKLEKAAFVQDDNPNVYTKYQETIGNPDKKYQVAKATIEGDQLRISVNDIVGIVNLTPTTHLRIRPKIGWDEIFDMFLTVHKNNRAVEYHGVPIQDFLADDVSIEDIFLIIAVNYLQALEPLHKFGFAREFETRRVDAVRESGRIDVNRSILNHRKGIPKQHYITKEVDYDTPIHELIHAAGSQLLRLFETHVEHSEHEGYYHIFSAVEKEVRYLEDLGVKSNFNSISEYGRISVDDLHRQRGYYRDIVEVSKTILSSSVGRTIESGHRELTIDYILNMEDLFEKYTQCLLSDVVKEIAESDLFSIPGDLSVDSKPTYEAYSDESDAYHQPDHVLVCDDEPLAVFDTKYHQSDADPTTQTGGRSRMFSYAYLLQVDWLGFLTPRSPPKERPVANHNARASVISAREENSENRFTTEKYWSAIRKYLETILQEEFGRSELFEVIENRGICHREVSDSPRTFDDLPDELSLAERSGLIHAILEQAGKNSDGINSHRDLSPGALAKYRQRIGKSIVGNEQEADYCVPIFFYDLDRGVEGTESEGLKVYYIADQDGIQEITNIDHISLE